jgi:hypothetical protein
VLKPLRLILKATTYEIFMICARLVERPFKTTTLSTASLAGAVAFLTGAVALERCAVAGLGLDDIAVFG